MKFTFNNEVKNLENVSKQFNYRCFSPRRRLFDREEKKSCITNSQIDTGSTKKFTRSSSSSSLNEFIDDEITSVSVETLLNEKTSIENIAVENQESRPIEEILKMVFTGNKDKIQDVTTKKEFIESLKEVNPESFMEIFKTLGEKLFDNEKELSSTTTNEIEENVTDIATQSSTENISKLDNTTQINTQLATPMATPLNNVFLDENLLASSVINKENDNKTLFLPKTPSVDLFTLPVIDTQMNQIMPSPDVFSPINGLIHKENILSCNIPSTPITPINPLTTPIMDIDSCLSDSTSIVSKDELNPFKSPIPMIETTPLINDSATISTITSPAEALLNTPQMASPFIGMFNDVTRNNSVSSINDLLAPSPIISGSTSSTFIPPLQNPSLVDSIVMASPLLQNNVNSVVESPFAFPVMSTPNLSATNTSTDINDEMFAIPAMPINTSIFEGNDLLGNEDVKAAQSEVTNQENKEEKNTNLEKVSMLLKELNNIINGNDGITTGTTSSSNSNGTKTGTGIETETETQNSAQKTSEVTLCDEDFGAFLEELSFPSNETIKQCKVNELTFNFTNENITKLVHLAPVEVVMEDVIELEKLSKLKRGKGRPRKPRKFSICPFMSCHKKFNREFNLKEHIRIHNPKRNKDFTCKFCNDSFFSASVLSRHIASIHEGEKFYCKKCGKTFNRKDALHRHEKISCHVN